MTPTISNDPEISFTALPPHHWANLASALGFMVPSFQIMNIENLDLFVQASRKEINKEGHVLYYLKSSNGIENTIELSKIKTFWYVISRAIREKAVYCFTVSRKKPNWSLPGEIYATHKRIIEIQKWLKFTDDDLAQWKVSLTY